MSRSPNTFCTICGRRNTLLIRLTAGEYPNYGHRWSCWRPAHIREAGRQAQASADRKAAFHERWPS